MTVSYRAPWVIRLADAATSSLIRMHQEDQIVPKVLQGSLEPLPHHTLTTAQCHGSLTQRSSSGQMLWQPWTIKPLSHLGWGGAFHRGEGQRKVHVMVEELNCFHQSLHHSRRNMCDEPPKIHRNSPEYES